jgi:hypothetical protein
MIYVRMPTDLDKLELLKQQGLNIKGKLPLGEIKGVTPVGPPNFSRLNGSQLKNLIREIESMPPRQQEPLSKTSINFEKPDPPLNFGLLQQDSANDQNIT